MNVAFEEYQKEVFGLRPTSVSRTITHWSEDYYIGGRLIRFSSMNNSHTVQKTDMFDELYLNRGDN